MSGRPRPTSRWNERAVILRRLGHIIEEAGAADELGLRLGHELRVEAVVEWKVAVGTEMQQSCARPFFDGDAGDVAGGDDRVISVVGNLQGAELLADRPVRTRRVGDEHDPAAAGTESAERLDGARKRCDAVVEDTPDIAEKRIVRFRQFVQPCDPLHPVSAFRPIAGRSFAWAA
jgi:hypothetical protein